jgi:hypothetical protein
MSLLPQSGQVASSDTAIFTSTDPAQRIVAAVFENTSSSLTETLVVSFTISGGSKLRLARAVLAPNEQFVINGLTMNTSDSLSATTTDASTVSYTVMQSSPNPYAAQAFDANGALKQVNTTANITGATTTTGLITGQAGLTITGAAVSLNASSNFNFAACSGNSTGTVTIGNSLAGAMALASGATSTITITGGNLTISTATSGNLLLTSVGASTYTYPAATASGLTITDGSNNSLVFDTTANTTGKTHITLTNPSITVAGASGTTNVGLQIAAKTLTTSTQTTITALNGLQMAIGTMTVNQSGGAVTVTTASSLYLQKIAAGASVTITNNYIINTDVAGCFLTAGGTWTSTSSLASKKDVEDIDLPAMAALIDEVRPVRFRHKDPSEGGFLRFGLIAQEVPECMAMPTRNGIGAIHVAGFAVAAVKYLKSENDALKARLTSLETNAA